MNFYMLTTNYQLNRIINLIPIDNLVFIIFGIILKKLK